MQFSNGEHRYSILKREVSFVGEKWRGRKQSDLRD
jgi:hypothetical protein